jgi:hypothetical protein
MSRIALSPPASGTATFTLSAPATNTDRTLSLPDEAGTILTSAGVPASALPAGSILQIVRATDATQRTTSSTSYVDASISVSITPIKSSSNILVLWQALVGPGSNNYINRAITNASNTALSGAELSQFGDASSNTPTSTYPVIGWVAATDTSARTYKGRFAVVSAGTATLFNSLNVGQIYAIEVSA